MSHIATKILRTINNLHLVVAGVFIFSCLFLASFESSIFAACSMPTDKGTVAMSINVESSASYRVWTRLYAPSSTDNSYLLQIDEELCNVTVGNAGITPNTWTWVDWRDGDTNNKINANLSAGQHTVTLAGSESNVQVDTVLLLSDTDCIPTGTSGTNCTGGAASAGPGSSEASGTDGNSSGGQANQNKADPEPVVADVSDVPFAAISAIANPTSIPRVIRGSYGWLIGLIMLSILLTVVGLFWYKRHWIIRRLQSLLDIFSPRRRFAGHPHSQSATHSTKIIHPTKGDPHD